jgi:hypothetical protein
MKSELYRKIELMQNSLIDCATGRGYNIKDYEDARQLIINNISLKKYIPDFVFLAVQRNNFGRI